MRALRGIAVATATLSGALYPSKTATSPQPSLEAVRSAQATLKSMLVDAASSLPLSILNPASQLLARSYTSIGCDDEAIDILLPYLPSEPTSSDDEVSMLIGLAYTRLHKHTCAKAAFLTSTTPRCTYHSLLSSMKAGDPSPLFPPSPPSIPPDDTINLEAPSIEALKALHDTLNSPSKILSFDPLYTPCVLLHSIRTKSRSTSGFDRSSLLLRLASINALHCHGPFSRLVNSHLDDKRGLHILLSGTPFYPRGAIINRNKTITYNTLPSEPSDLVSKRPLSWGGFGVEFHPCSTPTSISKDPLPCDIVLQERVQSLLKLNGKIFSLRLYVLCRDGQVFWSRECLCKFAEEGGLITNSAFTGKDREQVRDCEPLSIRLRFLHLASLVAVQRLRGPL